MSSTRDRGLLHRSLVVALIGAASTLAVFGSVTEAKSAPPHGSATSSRALAFHDEMRALWESHGTWTERAIVDFVSGVPDTPLVIGRLLQNQTDIGNAVKPYYGRKGASELTALLIGHINAAVAVLNAAKSGDIHAVLVAKAAFYANGNRVARFLHEANPHHWSFSAMKRMMRIHLDQVIGLAVDQLEGRYAAAVRLYDTYIDHILDMADMLSKGIIQQFPNRF